MIGRNKYGDGGGMTNPGFRQNSMEDAVSETPVNLTKNPQPESSPSKAEQGQYWWGPLLGVLGAFSGAIIGGVIGFLIFLFVIKSQGTQRAFGFFFLMFTLGGIIGTFCGLLYGLALEAKSITTSEYESWAGKYVFLLKGAPIWQDDKNGKPMYDENGQPVYAAMANNVTYLVLKDIEHDLLIRHGGIEGWIEKRNAILLENAASNLTAMIHADPNNAEAYNKRAVVWWHEEEYDIALTDLNNAIRLQPEGAVYYCNRAKLYTHRNKDHKAIPDFNEAIRLDPQYAEAFVMRGSSFRRLKDYPRAISDYSEAIRVDPNLGVARNLLAWLLATCPDDKYRDGKKAVESAIRACELTNWTAAGIIDTLAAAYAEVGDFDNAVKYQKQASEDPEYQERYLEGGRMRLELYKERKPYRE